VLKEILINPTGKRGGQEACVNLDSQGFVLNQISLFSPRLWFKADTLTSKKEGS